MVSIKTTIRYAINVIYSQIKLVCSRNRIRIGNPNLLSGGCKIICKQNGKITIGSHITNRGRQFLICEQGDLIIGSGCFFNDGCSITCLNKINIGEGCSFGNNVVIVDHDHDYKKQKGFLTSEIFIGKNVWVGANSVILRGVSIGDNSVIAAGTIVKHGVYPNYSMIRSDITTICNEISHC